MLQRSIERPLGVVLMSVLAAFTGRASPLGSWADSAVDANARLFARFREHRLPEFFTTVVYRLPEQARMFRARVSALSILRIGSREVAVDEHLAPFAGEAFIGTSQLSGFLGRELAAQLQVSGVDPLVVTGLATVGSVCRARISKFVPEDAVGALNKDAHAANPRGMHAKYADMVGSKEMMAALPPRRLTV